ncbi:type II and III secretion system protein family protein [Allopontixanthobacter sp.]|uniref:type II and III secretion system protein family protein n=1 Tax=Allopontixanthobacter sp. TaxID=2906452 RepID=UPI002ABC7188|nr:type II and III secretion system protein family protein [Allopontixanthobacter sp.]MDZ4307580.1 type II and III secretion system protein family protein [Allopontixanthobacter sp.]
MKRRLTATLLLSAIAVAPLAGGTSGIGAGIANAQSIRSPAQSIVLSIGRGELINVPGTMADVFVANDEIADVQVKSQSQLYVFGKAGGETTVYASNAAGDIVWSANVRVGSNLDSVDQMLNMAMPEARISVSTMGTNTVLLTGIVAAPEDAAEAERLVQAFVGEDSNVISRLKMATPLQVNLQVRFAEVSRTLVRTIGANLVSADSTSGFKFGIGQGRGAIKQFSPGGPLGTGVTAGDEGTSVVTSSAIGSTIAGFGRFLGLDLGAALDLAETEGLVTTLSQPNLTALSGETADFLAGGEFPIPSSGGLGTTTIEYRKFGVSLAYTPTVLANGRISIRVRPEVSELSAQGAVTVNGFTIPALTVRRAETTVELGSGQSFMIAGLMSNNAQNSIEKTPGLGDTPILGNLFRSRSFRRGETELVIIVTPYLVKPVDASEIKLPTDGFRTATELQSLIGYRENDGVSGASRPVPTVKEGTAPPPSMSQYDPAAVVPGSQTEERTAEASSPKRNKERTADAVAAVPGFSLK